MITFDSLTVPFGFVWRYRRGFVDSERGRNAWDDDCDCGRPPEGLHHSLCSVSPIYAAMCEEFGIPRIDLHEPLSLLVGI